MEVTKGERLYIGIFGNTNSGKSSLMNMLIGQSFSIVSQVSGTTTDSVQKNMELPGVGPCVFIDTAGFDDESELGKQRVEKTYEALAKCDVILAVLSCEELNRANKNGSVEKLIHSEGFQKLIKSGKPLVWAITKAEENDDLNELEQLDLFKKNVPVFVDSITGKNKELLIQVIKEKVPAGFLETYQASLTEKYCKSGENVLLVMPQDIQAPKGRLILPQVQTIRDLLDRKVFVHCCTQDTFLQTI